MRHPTLGYQSEGVVKVNSASFAAGVPGKGSSVKKFEIPDFNVVGSDKLVVTVVSEIGLPFEVNVKFSGSTLKEVVQTKGTTTAGIFYLDQPSRSARQGDIRVSYSKNGRDKLIPNGVAIYAIALAGTAPGFAETAAGKVGEISTSMGVSINHSYVIAAAGSDDLAKVPSNSEQYLVACDAPFSEVGEYNGLGNEIGSALAVTAEIVDCPKESVTARFLGLSNRRNRETVVVAAFAPAEK